MAINKVVYGGTTLIDLTADTVTADMLGDGLTAHDRSGVLITGTGLIGIDGDDIGYGIAVVGSAIVGSSVVS